MIECIFTIDYEIYGNGEGSLKELVYEPAKQLKRIFDEAGAKFVLFVEAIELEKIEMFRTDPAIDQVKDQIREFHQEGFEIALHLHPQWCNARYENGKWNLNYTEYNLCTLSERRITEIVGSSIAYLRDLLNAPDFTPLSFRAGNWLFQPTATAARVLAKHGIKIDSSVFKGGRQHKHDLDYRRTIKNGCYWKFENDVTIPNPTGSLFEFPIYTRMVPSWQLLTKKRLGLQGKGPSRMRTAGDALDRLRDLLRFRQPVKFDFCRMTLKELASTLDNAIRENRESPEVSKPMVAIGHTKDLVDFRTIELFLSSLKGRNIRVSTFEQISERCWAPLENAHK